ncbi:class C beta-lactamase [Noviherbaspirillum sp. CPCC 100848]|uniref:Beta-lactamase n=1 Tax=Noviherbaspirillum album TaxID=3080276 RepID=A0ABU6JAZ3_9BURK|nr:class C beta-lactamase [Noviherbaspirillum sp. CPCC 100848]MEC4720803.1 class C beta-lactamase [Noviherbaspirillum sp. CPCC 100848]
MYQKIFATLGSAMLSLAGLCTAVHAASPETIEDSLQATVDAAIKPVLQEHRIPGMSVAVTVNGHRYFYNYGVASRQSGQQVSQDTLFEIGSVSKTFTATLAAYGQALGTLSLNDPAAKYWPVLRGSAVEKISLLELGTYTAGGLPLQFPDAVGSQEDIEAYYKNWKPAYGPGTHRLYSNPSIALFGFLAARSMGKPYAELLETMLFPKLGLRDSHIRVPERKMEHYAWGYARDDTPVRVSPGPLDAEAYGVKSTSADLIRFVEANMNPSRFEKEMQQAISATHAGYFRMGSLTQGLGWERYSYPGSLDALIENSSADVVLKANPVTALDPSVAPQGNVLINKTGSTNGFGVYVAFVPGKSIGIVMLANRNYPNAARIKAAYRILSALEKRPAAPSR